MISGEIEGNYLAKIRLILAAKFGDDSLEEKKMFPVFLKSDNLKVFRNIPVKRPRFRRYQSLDFTKKMYLLRYIRFSGNCVIFSRLLFINKSLASCSVIAFKFHF